MKKILAIVLAAIMLIGCAAFASAAETTMPDIAFEGWWTNWSQGLEVTEEGFTVTFDVLSENATANYHSPTVIVHAGSAEAIGTEYWAQRADAWGWLYAENVGDHAAALQEKGYSWEFTFAEGFDWANFIPALVAGTNATVTAKLEGSNVLLTYAMAGVTNKVTIPVNAEAPVYLCFTGENCAMSNIVVSTPDADVEAPIADGDNVKIYFPKNETFISANANDNGKKLLEANEEEAAVFAVEVDENGYYSFVCDGKYLTSGETGNSLVLADAASDYSLWTLEAAENGWFIKSVNASYNGSAQYLEYYSGFTTYGKKDTADVTLYTYQFVAVEQEEEPVAVQGCLKYADADYYPATAGDCFFEYTGPGTYTISLQNITATYGAGLDVAYMLYIEFANGYETMKDLKVTEMSIVVDGEPIEVNLDYIWTYESLGTDYLPTGSYCIEIYNAFGYAGAGYGAAIDPNIFADDSIEITFTLEDPNAAPLPGTGDAIFAILSVLCVSGMGLTAVVSRKK